MDNIVLLAFIVLQWVVGSFMFYIINPLETKSRGVLLFLSFLHILVIFPYMVGAGGFCLISWLMGEPDVRSVRK